MMKRKLNGTEEWVEWQDKLNEKIMNMEKSQRNVKETARDYDKSFIVISHSCFVIIHSSFS